MMFDLLLDPILAIFAVLGVGFALQRTGGFDLGAAKAINKFVFFVATPALLFSIVSRLATLSMDLHLVTAYFAIECVIYASVAGIANKGFGREPRESLLLGMAACFVNHVFFVLPIAERIYGESVAAPIASIILVDGFIFCLTTVFMDLIDAEDKSVIHSLSKLAKNPFLIACALGMVSWLIPGMVPSAVMTYANFVGASAAPASLFALGIVLATHPIKTIGATTWLVVGSKVMIHPLLFFLLAGAMQTMPDSSDTVLLVAAGPCGAMPFVIALQYGVRSDGITKAIILSTLVSLFTLAALTA